MQMNNHTLTNNYTQASNPRMIKRALQNMVKNVCLVLTELNRKHVH